MPNHISNTLCIYCDDEEELQTILDEIKGDKEYIDFEVIVPQPEEVLESLDWTPDHGGKQPLDWYDWRCENWGTKWNAYEQDIQGPEYGEVVLRFETAWSPPVPIVETLKERFPNAYFSGAWIEEGYQSAGTF